MLIKSNKTILMNKLYIIMIKKRKIRTRVGVPSIGERRMEGGTSGMGRESSTLLFNTPLNVPSYKSNFISYVGTIKL